MPGKPTLIVFGATSYTAQELLPYLDNHPDGDDFDFILAGRNKQKLDALNDKRPKRRQVAVCDSNDEDAVKALVEKGDVVINLAGPFRWHGGEHFIKHCAIAGKHYVDLSGESHWLAQDIIPKYDYLASKTGACIVPSCGFDSIPSDLTLYYALRTLQHSYPSASITSSISYFKLRGGVSGGTVATMKSLLEIPAKERAQGEWALLSSANGSTPSPQFVYKTPVPSDGGRQEKKIGSFFFMYPYNRCIVRRSWFLSRLDTGVVSSSRQASHDNDDEQDDEPRHGDGFEYREAMETGSTLKAMLISGASLLFGVLFFGFSLTRRLLLAFVLPSPGEGVDEEQRAKGSMFITNISNTTEEGLDVVSTCQGKGDPGYKITAFMLAESALALVLPPPKGTSLPPIGIRGGVLTPSAAMGMVLVERLQKSGTVLFESRLVGKPKRS